MAEASGLVSRRTKVRAPSGGNPSNVNINTCARPRAAPLHGLIRVSDRKIKHGSLLRAILKRIPNGHRQTCRNAGANRFMKVIKGSHVLRLVIDRHDHLKVLAAMFHAREFLSKRGNRK